MYLDGVVCVLVGILRVHTLSKRGECVGKARVLLQFCALLRCELALARDVLKSLVDVYVACCLIEDRTTGVELSLDACNHVVNSRELNDGCVELLALASILQSLVVSSLANAYRLCGDAETCAVHESHYVLDKSEACRTAEFCLRVLVNKLAGR